jgi:predicted  nucleic acid-binding Zn-ribbon protein
MDNFGGLTVDRLRFEYDKRQNELTRLQMELSDLRREYAQVNDDWNEASSNLDSGADYRNFDAGGYQSGLAYISNQISQVSQRINNLRAEMSAIEEALNN